mgnify:CR=1 FL=1
MEFDKKIIALAVIVILVGISLYGLYQYQTQKTQVVILHAGSLAVPLYSVKTAFENQHPNVEVLLEGHGSVDCARLIVEGNRTTDILAVADYNVIIKYIMPANLTDWYIVFARNEMVIAFTNQSRYHNEINSTNWYQILARPDVSYGHSDPNRDPAGYRTLLLWKLADKYYNASIYDTLIQSAENHVIRPKSVELIALLESHDLDYAFEYKSVAVQHNLSYIELSPEINLGDWTKAELYSTVNVTLTDGTVIYGTPILYGFTILKNAPHYELAVSFAELLLSDQGDTIFENAGQPPISPALASNLNKIPTALQQYATSFNS